MKHYIENFKKLAVSFSYETSISNASLVLGVPYQTLVSWRAQYKKLEKYSLVGIDQPPPHMDKSYIEKVQENKRLRRDIEILRDALHFYISDQGV